MNLSKRMLLLGCMGITYFACTKAQTYLQIHTGNQVAKFPYERVSEVQFDTDALYVIADSESIPFLYSDISKIDFSDNEQSGIKTISANQSYGILILEGDIIKDSAGNEINIFNMLGAKVATFKASGSISQLPSGIYVAISNDKKLKFIK